MCSLYALCASELRTCLLREPSPGGCRRGPAPRQACAAWGSSAAAAVTKSHRPRGLSNRAVASRSWRLKPEARRQCRRCLALVLFPLTDGHLPLAVSLRGGVGGEREHTLWCLFSLGRQSHHEGLTLVTSSKPNSLQRPGLKNRHTKGRDSAEDFRGNTVHSTLFY